MSMFDRLEDTLRRYEDVTAELGNPDIVGKYEDFHDRNTLLPFFGAGGRISTAGSAASSL